MILFKCFMRVLPDNQLASFEKTVTQQSPPLALPALAPDRVSCA